VVHRDRFAGQHRVALAETGRQRELGVELLAQAIADELIHRPVEIAAAIEQIAGNRELLVEFLRIRLARRRSISACIAGSGFSRPE
jgi:hypothetical protein